MSIALPVISTQGEGEPVRRPPVAPAHASRPDHLVDSHGRTIRDLRLSITDRCNYRCRYCMEPDYRYMPKMELLDLEEYIRVVEICLSLGVEKIRITGGEPTLYRHLDALLESLGRMDIVDLAMTTNGSRMPPESAHQWKALGLDRITLSLDSLRDDRIRHITRSRGTSLQTTINAIRAAHDAGLTPVKVNAVVTRGQNDDEIADFADFAREHAVHMRLIEFMPLDSGHTWQRDRVVTADEMLDVIGARHSITPVTQDRPDSTSLNFNFADGAPGSIGIIASVTRAFCGACSRLRITADGKVRPCLFSLEEWDLRPILRSGGSDADLRAFLVDSVWTKQAGHGINSADYVQPDRAMSAIGG